jgi:diacylglycerol kinase (ATP)
MLKKLLRSFSYAWEGLIYTIKTQLNMQIHLLVLVVVILLGFWVGLNFFEWSIIIMVSTMVLVAEMLNTAIEAAVDIKTSDYHELAKVAKDVAAAAVLLASLAAVLVGIILIGPKVLLRL